MWMFFVIEYYKYQKKKKEVLCVTTNVGNIAVHWIILLIIFYC